MNLREAHIRYHKAQAAVNDTFEPTREQWNELDAAAEEYRAAEQREQDRLDTAERQKLNAAKHQEQLEAVRAANERQDAQLSTIESVRRFRNAMIVAAMINAIWHREEKQE